MTRTVVLMSVLMLIFVWIGNMLGGMEGMKMAFFAACGMNFFSYFFSDKLVLAHYKAKEVTAATEPQLYEIVARLAQKANLPMPKVYIIPESVPNAFATGRNPKHAAVAATQGLLQLLTPQEVEGVLAHEMSHVRHYDILIGSVAAVFAGAIAMLGNMARTVGAANDNRSQNRGNPLFTLIAVIVMPIAAGIIQMAISRTREYKADEGAARLTEHPEWLMSALFKLDNYAKNYPMRGANAQTAHMFIVNPFGNFRQTFSSLFATHPSTADRIAALQKMQISGR
ncbi:MAG: zinc metalloprotease HtpX [Alphaproteobacteria bacterium]|nr:zinc metalloprotease HtpX [Alphaproteobacteria bacterium]